VIIALTGGIGAGKSTALDYFAKLGAVIEDTDRVVHKIYNEDTEVHQSLEARWGKEVFTNNLPNRQAIAEIVFNNKLELDWLNKLLHPLVKKRIHQLKQLNEITIVAVPLLYEVNWQSEFDKVISIWTNDEQQTQRLIARGWSKAEIQARLMAQMNKSEKLTRADFGLINNWSLDTLNRQCRSIYELLLKKGP
jgi:dephospho-CoA kinase